MSKNKLERFEENKTFPNMFQCSFEEAKQHFPLKGKWNSDFFKNNNPIVLELGCGKGEYTIGLAKEYPDKNFVGIDRKGARMWCGCKTSNEEAMSNVAFLRAQIQLIELFFAANEVDEIWITFPDPQLKKPNKRLTSERFLSYYNKVVKPNATMHLKTDSYELYDYTLNEVLSPNHYPVIFYSDDLYNSGCEQDVTKIKTFYEKMFLEQGKKTTYIQFKMK